FGPMIVISHTVNGSYHLAKINKAISKLKFAIFYLIPYHAHSLSTLKVTQFL
ncbi:uncharacterized protein F5147DRAFT_556761, partial [Suillus discolor]